MPELSTQALDDLRVVELPCFDSMPFFAAAMAAKVLADHGAEVIKVEPPGAGAAERRWGPFPHDQRNRETGALHLYLNLNKQSVTLDLFDADDRILLERLLENADVVINPNRPILNGRLGLEWRRLRARYPRLLVVSTTFFGADSPYRDLRAGDLVATQMSVVGYGTPMQQVTDLPTQPPLRLGGRQSDYVTGYTAAAATLCALAARARNDGAGTHVDVSQWLAMAQMCRPELAIYSHEAPDAPYRQRLLIRKKSSIQYMFPCDDGWVSCGLATNRHWRGVKEMMAHPDWAENEMFNSIEHRLQHSDALEAMLIDWLSTRGRSEVFGLAQAAHVPAFPVNSPADVAANEQFAARGYFVDCDHPVAGRVRIPGAPIRFSRTPWRIRRPAPCLGEHNQAVLGRQLGLTADTIARIAMKSAPTVDPALHTQAAPSPAVPTPTATEQPNPQLPFAGLRVLDFGWIYALPYGTAWLAALGADVIKVESMIRPDLVRFLSGTDGVTAPNRSGIFNSINFSKRSLALNLAHPEARTIARRLVAVSDIVSENFTQPTMPALGLAWDDLRQIKPDLIMLSGTSLGQTGPLAATVGWGPTNQAFAGTSYLTGYPNSFPCAGGGTWPDFAVGVAMLFALTAALHHRERTGEGQYIDVSMCEVVNSMLPEAMIDYFMNGREARAIGNRDPEMAPHGVYATAGEDRWIAIAIVDDAEFGVLCAELGLERLATEPDFATTAARLQHVEALEGLLSHAIASCERDELVGQLRLRGLAAGPVYSADQLIRDPAFVASGMARSLSHKECGERLTPTLPVGFSTIAPTFRAAPLLGEHSAEILRGLLGYGADEIERLREDKVIV